MSCNCCFEQIGESYNGSILRMNNNYYRIEFGNMLISFKRKQFDLFKHFILDTTKKKAEELLLPPYNKIIIQPSNNTVSYTFTLNEFIELKQLFNNAEDYLKIEEELKTLFK